MPDFAFAGAYNNSDHYCQYDYCLSAFNRRFPSEAALETLRKTVTGVYITSTIIVVTITQSDITTTSSSTYYTETEGLRTLSSLAAWWGNKENEPCCDFLHLSAGTIQMRYWPTEPPTPEASTVVENGYTYRYPSIYWIFNTIAAVDGCSTAGGDHANQVIAFDRSVISSMSPVPHIVSGTTENRLEPFSIDWQKFHDQNCGDVAGYSYDPYDPSNQDPFSYDPCHPRIAVPPGFATLVDPAWSAALNDDLPWGYYDPPVALALQDALSPTVTPIANPVTALAASVQMTPAAPTVTPTATPKYPVAGQELGESTSNSAHDPSQDSPAPGSESIQNNPSQQNPQTKEPQNSVRPDDPSLGSLPQSDPHKDPSQEIQQQNSPLPNDSSPNGQTGTNPLQSEALQNKPQEDGPPSDIKTSNTPHLNEPILDPIYPAVDFATRSDLPFQPLRSLLSSISVPFTTNNAGNVVLPTGQTLSAGGPVAVVSATPISLGRANLVVGDHVYAIPSPAPPSLTPGASVTVAGYTFMPNPTGFVIAGMTILPHDQALTLIGTPISLGSSTVKVGDQTYALPGPTPTHVSLGAVLTVGDQTMTFNPTVVIVAGTTLLPGGPDLTIAGTRISLGTSNLAIGSQAYALSTPPTQITRGELFTLAGYTIKPNPTGFDIAGSELVPGGPALIVSGTAISLGSSEVIIGSKTYAFPDSPTPMMTDAAMTVGGNVFTPSPGGFEVAGTKVMPGGTALIVSGTTISLGLSELIIGSKTYAIPESPTPIMTGAIMTADGYIFTPSPTGFEIAGTKIIPGGVGLIISGTTISLSPSNLIIGSRTYNLPTNPTRISSGAVMTVAEYTFTPSLNGFDIAGTKILPGGAALTIFGTVVSLSPSNLIIGSQTYELPTNPTRINSGAILTVAGYTFTPAPTGFDVAGTRLTPGGPSLVISATTISLSPSDLVIGVPSATAPQTMAFITPPPKPLLFITDGHTFATAATGFIVDNSQTLLPGQALTLMGAVVSLTPEGNTLLVGNHAIPLTKITDVGLAGLITSGLGPINGAHATATRTARNDTEVMLYHGSSVGLKLDVRLIGTWLIGIWLWHQWF